MVMPFRVPKRFCCEVCDFKDNTLQKGDLVTPPNFDLKCPQCGSVLDLKDISSFEQALYKLRLLK